MNQKSFANIVLIFVVIAIVAIGGYFVFVKKSEPLAQQPTTTPTQSNPTPVVSQTPPPTTAPTNTVTISPTSGPAGSMVAWSGRYSVCGANVDPSECTTDRFDQLVFLQNGSVVSDTIETYASGSQKVIQIPTTLSPGVYQLAMQNCFGKGCTNDTLATFTVLPKNQTTTPAITSISPSSINNLTTTVTIHGSGFTATDNYISFMSTGVGNTNPYLFISKVVSSDGNTIIFQFPSCYASTPPTCGSFAYGASQFAVANVNGTSNNMPFTLLVQPYRFK